MRLARSTGSPLRPKRRVAYSPSQAVDGGCHLLPGSQRPAIELTTLQPVLPFATAVCSVIAAPCRFQSDFRYSSVAITTMSFGWITTLFSRVCGHWLHCYVHCGRYASLDIRSVRDRTDRAWPGTICDSGKGSKAQHRCRKTVDIGTSEVSLQLQNRGERPIREQTLRFPHKRSWGIK